jgi:hypothetical protein
MARTTLERRIWEAIFPLRSSETVLRRDEFVCAALAGVEAWYDMIGFLATAEHQSLQRKSRRCSAEFR